MIALGYHVLSGTGDRRRRGLAVALAASLIVAGLSVVRAVRASAVTPRSAVVTVDAATSLGRLNNPAWYLNQTDALRPGEAARQREIGPARVARVWAKPHLYYDHTTGGYDFAKAYRYFDDAASRADSLLANVDQCDQPLMDLSAPATCREVLKETIKHFKLRYPTLRYVELFNEPDKNWPVGPEEKQPIAVDEYYQWFQIAYRVVNEVNAELDPDIPVAIGGPVTYRFNERYLQDFLDRYRDDQDPAKRLDFISYHDYGRRSNPAAVGTAKSTIRSWCSARGIDSAPPVFVTEYGVFPGGPDTPTGQGTTYAEDLLTQAAAMATLGMFYVAGDMDAPMHWVYNHPTNERKSMFVDGQDGAVHPYYNVVRAQRALKETRIDSRSNALSADGLGVNVVATKDDTGVAVLTTNYQWTTGTDEFDTRLDVKNLPAAFTGAKVLVERYLIDATTSNYAHDPSAATLRRVERYVASAGSSATARFPLGRNAVSLVVLTPLVQEEAETLTAVASTGDTVTSIADTAASGGRLSKLAASGPGDFARYQLPVPRAGEYRVVARMKTTPDRGVARVDIGGSPQGEPIDTYTTGYGFVDVDLGSRAFATAGLAAVTFTMTGTSSGGYTLGVDTISLLPLVRHGYEVERNTPTGSTGDRIHNLSDSGASGGGLVKLAANAEGDWLRFVIHVPAAGRFQLAVAFKAFPNRGTCQLSVNGAPVGEPLDGYAAAAGFVTRSVGAVTIEAAGATTVACQVTGRNAASGGYEIALDRVDLRELGS